MDFSGDLDSQLNLSAFCSLPCLGVVDGVLAGEPLCCQTICANMLDTLDAEDIYAIAEVLTSTALAMELSRQSSKWVSALKQCLYFQGFLSIVTKVG